jgi:Domain of unknown function (DUF1996)
VSDNNLIVTNDDNKQKYSVSDLVNTLTKPEKSQPEVIKTEKSTDPSLSQTGDVTGNPGLVVQAGNPPSQPTKPEDHDQVPVKNYLPSGLSSDQLLISSGESVPALSSDGTGSFRIVCRFSHMLNDDPLVQPGIQGSSHLHSFFGNTLTNASSTSSTLKNSGSSTCDGGIANRSSYWAPTLLDDKNVPVPVEYGFIYYKSGYRSVLPEKINNLPAGLKMIAGSMSSTTKQNPDIVSWSCESPTYTGEFQAIPDFCGLNSRMVYVITFPQCWNGKDLDSADHKSHMAYPVYGSGCPASHPVALPVISLKIKYIQNSASTLGWHLASDHYDTTVKPGGMSAHADFMEGWNDAIRDTFTEHCIRQARDCGVRPLGNGQSLTML